MMTIFNFSAENRGIFSLGIYFGYGLAYIYGKYLSDADSGEERLWDLNRPYFCW